MAKRKVCVVITARPSYSRVKTLMEECLKNENLELQIVVSSSAMLPKYGNTIARIEQDGFQINEQVYSLVEGNNPIISPKTTGLAILELSSVFQKLNPDIVVTIADRYETIATAISAAYLNIPLAHIQGGEVTGNIDEKVRHSITKLADYHFVATKESYDRVLRLGESPEFTFITGCPSIDIAKNIQISEDSSFNPFLKYGGVGGKFDLNENFLVVLQHPVTNEFGSSMQQINQTIDAIEELDENTFWFWPNPDSGTDDISKGLRQAREQGRLRKTHFFRSFDPEDFLKLLLRSSMIIGNSSVGIRECSYLGVPAINIGSRQNRRERGPNVKDVNYSSQEIVDAANIILSSQRVESSLIYGDGLAGYKIAEKLATVPLVSSKTITY